MTQPLIFSMPKLKRWQAPNNAFNRGLGARATFFDALEIGYNSISAPRCLALMDRELNSGFDFVGVAMRVSRMVFRVRGVKGFGERHRDIVYPSLFAVAVMKAYPFQLHNVNLVDYELKRFIFYTLFDFFKANYSETLSYVSSGVTDKQKQHAFEGLLLRFTDIVKLSGVLEVTHALETQGYCVKGRRVIFKHTEGFKYFGLNCGLPQGKQLYPYNGGRLKHVIQNNPIDFEWYEPLCLDNTRLKDAVKARREGFVD